MTSGEALAKDKAPAIVEMIDSHSFYIQNDPRPSSDETLVKLRQSSSDRRSDYFSFVFFTT